MAEPDPWAALRGTTRARIGLGRVGDAPPLRDVLAFQLAHARARDAVHTPLDMDALAAALPGPSLRVWSAAGDRAGYLRRPDLGRVLDPASHGALDQAIGPWDIVFVVADGLSPIAVQAHAVPMLAAARARLPGWTVAPVVMAGGARVALGDAIGERIGAAFCVMLIGERPGLTAADSLGLYITYAPRPGRRDSERNCISNIHAHGTSYDGAADLLAWLLHEARRIQGTGITLKDDRSLSPQPQIGSGGAPRGLDRIEVDPAGRIRPPG